MKIIKIYKRKIKYIHGTELLKSAVYKIRNGKKFYFDEQHQSLFIDNYIFIADSEKEFKELKKLFKEQRRMTLKKALEILEGGDYYSIYLLKQNTEKETAKLRKILEAEREEKDKKEILERLETLEVIRQNIKATQIMLNYRY